jgi:DNA polymerase-3 subunit delta'
VVLVYPAERMNHITANALLKTLEEPGKSVRFVLATEAAHLLLPTVRSRCQDFPLRWPAQTASYDWLAALANTEPPSPPSGAGPDTAKSRASTQRPVPPTPAQITVALRAAGQRPLDAQALLADGRATVWASLPKALAAGQGAPLADWTPSAALDALQKLCHDLWVLRVGGEPRFFEPQDLPNPPPAASLLAWGRQLTTLARQIEHPWKAELLLQDLAAQAKRWLRAKPNLP